MYYKKKLNKLNNFIKIVIKPNNKFYKLAMKIYYSNTNSQIPLYYEHRNYCIK